MYDRAPRGRAWAKSTANVQPRPTRDQNVPGSPSPFLPLIFARESLVRGYQRSTLTRGVGNSQKSVRDFEILRFQMGFRDFNEDFKISDGILGFL